MSDLWDRANARIPGGVNSPVRAWRAMGETPPFFVVRGDGAYLHTSDGRRLIDYVQSWGASILGHAHPRVTSAISDAAANGTSYGAPTPREVELAERISAAVPSVEKLRLVSSGTEATMTAIRLARGFTGRDVIVKFAGCYHGHADMLLAAAGSGLATFGITTSAGVPDAAVAKTIVLPFNDAGALDDVFAHHGGAIAAVITEPVPANMGLVPPHDGFLAHVQRQCREHGALFICDEVITGFRLGTGGAQAWYGLEPDLSCFGKVIGGGLPLAAFGGRAEIMNNLAPLGPVYQAGTLSGNPVATAAGLAVLDELTPALYELLTARATRLTDGLRTAITSAGLAVQSLHVGPICGLFFADRPVLDYAGAQASDGRRYAAFFHAMIERGVYLAPSAFEAFFPSLAHTDEILDETIAAAESAARAIT